jgi:hypothetical protein
VASTGPTPGIASSRLLVSLDRCQAIIIRSNSRISARRCAGNRSEHRGLFRTIFFAGSKWNFRAFFLVVLSLTTEKPRQWIRSGSKGQRSKPKAPSRRRLPRSLEMLSSRPKAKPTKTAGKIRNAIGGLKDTLRGKRGSSRS